MHQQFRTELRQGGRITIPVALREQLGLSIGDVVVLDVNDDHIRLLSTKQMVKDVQALMAPYLQPGTSMADELIQERRAEAAREAAEHADWRTENPDA